MNFNKYWIFILAGIGVVLITNGDYLEGVGDFDLIGLIMGLCLLIIGIFKYFRRKTS